MKNLNYKQIAEAIKNNEPFTHNGTMTGEIVMLQDIDSEAYEGLQYEHGNDSINELDPADYVYIVKSYATTILAEVLWTKQLWYNDKRYSRTTSRQQGIIKRAKGIRC